MSKLRKNNHINDCDKTRNIHYVSISNLIKKEISKNISLPKILIYLVFHIYSILAFLIQILYPPLIFLFLYINSFFAIIFLEKYDFHFDTRNLIILIIVDLFMTILFTLIFTISIGSFSGKRDFEKEDFHFFFKFIDTFITIIVSIFIAFTVQSITLNLFPVLSINQNELEFLISLFTFMILPVKLICIISLYILDNIEYSKKNFNSIQYLDVVEFVNLCSEWKKEKKSIVNEYKDFLNKGNNISPEVFLRKIKIPPDDVSFKSLIKKLSTVQNRYNNKKESSK